MRFRHRQQGLSTVSLILVIVVAVFFGTCAIKLLPVYIESMTVKKAVEITVTQARTNKLSPTEIRDVLGKQLDVNRAEAINARDVVITRRQGKTTVDATYEARIPLMFNIDVIIKFDQLKYDI